MLRSTLIFCFLLILCFLAPHQSAQGQGLSIAQLYEQLEQSSLYQQEELRERIARENYRELRSDRIPVFYVDANLQRNLIIPSTPVPAIAFDPTAPEGAIIPLKFATKWSSKAGIQLEWQLFDPKRRAVEEEQKLNVEQAEIQKLQVAQDWTRDATLAYASVVLATEQYELALQDSAAYAEILDLSRIRYEAGRLPLAEYVAAQQELERKRIQLHEAWAVLLEADQELRLYVDLVSSQSLSTDIAGIIAFLEPRGQANRGQVNRGQVNYTLQSLAVDQRINALQQAAVRRQLWPSLSFNGYLGEQYFSNSLRLGQRDQWFGNSFVNLALRWPLSAYFTAGPTLRKLSFTAELQARQIQQEELSESVQQAQNLARVAAARSKLSSLERIEILAAELREERQAGFLAGRVLLSDYNEALSAWIGSRQDVWQGQYELIQRLVESTIGI